MNALRLTTLGLGLVALALTGCGSDPDGLSHGGELSGTVTLNGKPLGGGRIEVYSEDGQNAVACQIRPDGGFTLREPPLGPCKVVVKTSQLKGMMPAKTAKVGGGIAEGSRGMTLPKDVGLVYTPIPGKYEDVSTTDLQVTVAQGKQSHDIKMTR